MGKYLRTVAVVAFIMPAVLLGSPAWEDAPLAQGKGAAKGAKAGLLAASQQAQSVASQMLSATTTTQVTAPTPVATTTTQLTTTVAPSLPTVSTQASVPTTQLAPSPSLSATTTQAAAQLTTPLAASTAQLATTASQSVTAQAAVKATTPVGPAHGNGPSTSAAPQAAESTSIASQHGRTATELATLQQAEVHQKPVRLRLDPAMRAVVLRFRAQQRIPRLEAEAALIAWQMHRKAAQFQADVALKTAAGKVREARQRGITSRIRVALGEVPAPSQTATLAGLPVAQLALQESASEKIQWVSFSQLPSAAQAPSRAMVLRWISGAPLRPGE